MSFRLELQIIDPADEAFRLDVDVLDGMIPLRVPQQGRFHLDRSQLDDARLAPIPPRPIWWDLAPWCQTVTTRHGSRAGIVIEPEPGALTADLLNCPDLTHLGVHSGTPIRLTRDGTILWAGTLDDIEEQWSKRDNQKRTEITASDTIAALAAQTRYGAQVRQLIRARLEALAASAPIPLTVSLPINPGTICEPTLHESSLTKHLAMAATTARASWTIRDGSIILLDPAAPAPPRLVLTDTTAPSYLELRRSGGSSQLVTAVDITSHGIGSDGNTADVTRTITDPTSVNAFGHRTGSASVTARPADIDQIGRWLLAPLTSTAQTITEVTTTGETIPTTLQPLDPIDIIRLGRRHHVRVLAIAHALSIDPGPAPEISHTTTLTLTRRNPQ